jgi:hypothetical protein
MKSANYKAPHYAFFLSLLLLYPSLVEVFSSSAPYLFVVHLTTLFQFSDYIMSNKRAISE